MSESPKDFFGGDEVQWEVSDNDFIAEVLADMPVRTHSPNIPSVNHEPFQNRSSSTAGYEPLHPSTGFPLGVTSASDCKTSVKSSQPHPSYGASRVSGSRHMNDPRNSRPSSATSYHPPRPEHPDTINTSNLPSFQPEVLQSKNQIEPAYTQVAQTSYDREHQNSITMSNPGYDNQRFIGTHEPKQGQYLPANPLPYEDFNGKVKPQKRTEKKAKAFVPVVNLPDANFIPFRTADEFFAAKFREVSQQRIEANFVVGFPADDVGKEYLVEQVVRAMKNLDDIVNIVNPELEEDDSEESGADDPNPQATKSKKGSKKHLPPAVNAIKNGLYSDRILYTTAWEILYAAAACQSQYNICKKYVPETVKSKSYITFQERFAATVNALRICKAACKDVLLENRVNVLVVNPLALVKGKQNNQKTNTRRNKQVKTGKEVLNSRKQRIVEGILRTYEDDGEEIAVLARVAHTRDTKRLQAKSHNSHVFFSKSSHAPSSASQTNHNEPSSLDSTPYTGSQRHTFTHQNNRQYGGHIGPEYSNQPSQPQHPEQYYSHVNTDPQNSDPRQIRRCRKRNRTQSEYSDELTAGYEASVLDLENLDKTKKRKAVNP